MPDPQMTRDPTVSNAAATRIFLRPIATPIPLGFFALATASLLLAGAELHWFTASDRTIVAVVLVAFTFPLQLLASVFGFLGRDTAVATSFGVLCATWLVLGIDRLLTPPGHTSPAVGVLLLAAAGWVALCATGASLGKLGPAIVLGLAALRFAVTGVHELTGSGGLQRASAIVGLVLVAAVVYVALALELESLQRRTLLPVLRRGRGREAVEGDLADQTRTAEHEPGVREQL